MNYTKTTKADAGKIFEIVRERGAQSSADIAARGIPLPRQIACAPLVKQMLEDAGVAA